MHYWQFLIHVIPGSPHYQIVDHQDMINQVFLIWNATEVTNFDMKSHTEILLRTNCQLIMVYLIACTHAICKLKDTIFCDWTVLSFSPVCYSSGICLSSDL